MAAKVFEVGDILPATTNLRISWIINVDYIGNDLTGGTDSITYIKAGSKEIVKVWDYDDTIQYIYINSINVFNSSEDGWQSPYTKLGDGHAYIDLDTSEWSIQDRTITLVNSEISNIFQWEDLNAPSGYSVTFEENGGTLQTDLTDQTNLPDPLPEPTKEYYEFVGWYVDAQLSYPGTAGMSLSQDITLYAKWVHIGFNITYEENGGTEVTGLTEQTNLPTPLPTTTRLNHVFAGWYYDNLYTIKANAGNALESSVTLYAKWYSVSGWFSDVADAIRTKDGTAETIEVVEFPDRITALPSPKEEETKTLTPNFSSDNQVVTPTTGKVLSQVTLTKPADLLQENVAKDKNVCGVVGTSFIAIELTQAQYDALVTKDSNTYYLIIEES